jgi:hypothetical protein
MGSLHCGCGVAVTLSNHLAGLQFESRSVQNSLSLFLRDFSHAFQANAMGVPGLNCVCLCPYRFPFSHAASPVTVFLRHLSLQRNHRPYE